MEPINLMNVLTHIYMNERIHFACIFNKRSTGQARFIDAEYLGPPTNNAVIDFDKNNLLLVRDKAINAWRSIPYEGIICIQFDGQAWRRVI